MVQTSDWDGRVCGWWLSVNLASFELGCFPTSHFPVAERRGSYVHILPKPWRKHVHTWAAWILDHGSGTRGPGWAGLLRLGPCDNTQSSIPSSLSLSVSVSLSCPFLDEKLQCCRMAGPQGWLLYLHVCPAPQSSSIGMAHVINTTLEGPCYLALCYGMAW